MVRDHFKTPPSPDLGAVAHRALAHLFPNEPDAGRTAVICTPASQPRIVIDAVARDPGCEKCKRAVWVSPSTARLEATAPVLLVCMGCFVAAGLVVVPQRGTFGGGHG